MFWRDLVLREIDTDVGFQTARCLVRAKRSTHGVVPKAISCLQSSCSSHLVVEREKLGIVAGDAGQFLSPLILPFPPV